MADYTLINNNTGEVHELDFENIVDIKSTLYAVKEGVEVHRGECFDETLEKMLEVITPVTDY